jgi:aryl-alcohol dehydrogenase-like predicted oxidoreductase
MVQGLDESLKRLKLDYVDVLYVHAWDHRTPIDETMRYAHLIGSLGPQQLTNLLSTTSTSGRWTTW